MLALLTATTDLAGSRVDYSSALAHGMAGDALGAGVVGDEGDGVTAAVGAMAATVGAFTVGAATMVDVGSPAEAMLVDAATRVVRSAASMVEQPFMEVAASMAEAAFTVAVVDTAADTANQSDRGA
jgi:hypothetical protein